MPEETIPSSKSTEKAFIYFYYGKYRQNTKIWEDQRNTIPLAIATLRKWNKDVKVYVADASDEYIEWGDFPKALNFKVIRIANPLGRNMVNCYTDMNRPNIKMYPTLLSKPLAVANVALVAPEQQIIYSDADIFWIKDPFPLLGDIQKDFCVGWNTGIYYYDKANWFAQRWLDMWKGACLLAMNEWLYREKLHEWNTYHQWEGKMGDGQTHIHDESISNYLIDFYTPIMGRKPYVVGLEENFLIQNLFSHSDVFKTAKNVHVQCGSSKNIGGPQKVRACVRIQEIRDIITSVLDKSLTDLYFENWGHLSTVSIYDTQAMQSLLWG